MQQYQNVLQDKFGNVIVGASVAVFVYGTTTGATLYSGNGTGLLPSNSVITNSLGEFAFYAANGRYSLSASATNFVTQDFSDFILYDPADIGAVTATNVAFTPFGTISATNVQNAIQEVVTDLSASSGSSLVGFIQSGTGAVARTVQAKERDTVSVKDFGAVGDGVTDDTAAIQAAINAAATRSLVGTTVYLPAGSYKVSSTLYTYGSGGTGQVALVGDGMFASRLIPNGDFTVLNLVSSYVESGGFSIEWPTTAAASIPTTRIGVELAGANWQFSYATLKNVTVNYGYRGFVLNDWTGQPFGTAYLCTLRQLTAFRCADWGFYLNSKTGSTTLRMIHCYVRGDNSSGGAQYGKGLFVSNFNDIYTEQLAIDQCLNSWVQFVNYNVCVMNGTALEANKISSAASRGVYFNGSQTVVNGFKDISATYDTSGIAQVIFCGATCMLSLSGYNEQYSTVVVGTTKYRVAFNAATTDVNIVDRSVLSSNVLNNGWMVGTTYQGVRQASNGLTPSYGTWSRGDVVKNGAPSGGQPKGWQCVATGTTGATLSGAIITGIAGQFSCTAAALAVGMSVKISGTFGGTGSITGYVDPTTYYIITTNGSTTFTLSATYAGAAITTTAGTPTGLTYTTSNWVSEGVL